MNTTTTTTQTTSRSITLKQRLATNGYTKSAYNGYNRGHGYTLDLHGYRREDAIEKVTRFFEVIRTYYYRCYPSLSSSSNSTTSTASSSNFMSQTGDTPAPPTYVKATIITGLGKHSQYGPVLKQAVQALLDKRHMNYTLTSNKGSFIVNAISGIDLYSAPLQPTTTKLIVQSSNEHDNDDNIKLVNRIKHSKRRYDPKPGEDPSIHYNMEKEDENDDTHDEQNNSNGRKGYVIGYEPTPAELAKEERLVERAKEQSEQEQRQIQKQERHASKEVHQAMTLSKHQFKREIQEWEELQEQEQSELDRMLELSLNQTSNKDIDESCSQDEDDEDELKRIMEFSLQQEEQHQSQRQTMEQEQEEELKRIMELSLQQQKQDTTTEEKELEQIMELSKREIQEMQQQKEEEELAQALQEIQMLEQMEHVVDDVTSTSQDCYGSQHQQQYHHDQEEDELERAIQESKEIHNLEQYR